MKVRLIMVTEINDILQWVVPIGIGIFMSIFSYFNREAFRRGSSRGQSEVTTTILTNTIKELERTNEELEKTNKKLDEQKEMIIRLQEQLKNTCSQINELRSRLRMPRVHFENLDEYTS